MNKETYDKLQLKSEEYAASGAVLTDEAFREGAYWLNEQYGWKDVNDVKPPIEESVFIRLKRNHVVQNVFVGKFLQDRIDLKPFFMRERDMYLLEKLKENGFFIEWAKIPD